MPVFDQSIYDEEFRQLIANARENADDADEAAFVERMAKQGWKLLSSAESNRLQAIADR